MSLLLKSLKCVKQLTLSEMELADEHIYQIPKLLQTSSSRKVLVLNLSQNRIGI